MVTEEIQKSGCWTIRICGLKKEIPLKLISIAYHLAGVMKSSLMLSKYLN